MPPERHKAEPLPEPRRHQTRVPKHDVHDFTEAWRVCGSASRKHVREVPEQPRPPETTSTDNDAVATGLSHHPQRIFCFPDVPVPQNRNLYKLFETRDCFPIGKTVVELCSSPRMQSNRSTTFLLCDATGTEIRDEFLVHADPELDRDGNMFRVTHGRPDDLSLIHISEP